MATGQPMKASDGMLDLSWGDTVRVKLDAPKAFRPGDSGDIVAITEVETQRQARRYGVAIGTKVYQVEFGDGQALEVPEAWIEAASGHVAVQPGVKPRP